MSSTITFRVFEYVLTSIEVPDTHLRTYVQREDVNELGDSLGAVSSECGWVTTCPTAHYRRIALGFHQSMALPIVGSSCDPARQSSSAPSLGCC